MKVEKLWNLECNDSILGIRLGDINNKGQIEVVAHTKSGKLLIITLSGTIIRQVVITQNSPIWHLEIHDINNDKKNELILGGLDGVLRTYKVSSTYNLSFISNNPWGIFLILLCSLLSLLLKLKWIFINLNKIHTSNSIDIKVEF